jgi:hypothetical protein
MKIILFVFVTLATPVFAQLKWENTEQAFTPKPTDKTIIAHYRFTNTGASEVTVKDLRTSCGCTTAALEKKEYAPGESGEIQAKFQFAGRIGHQEKWILVTTNLAPDQPTVLRLAVNIPVALTIQPELVMWRVGEKPESKTIRIAVSDDFPAKIISVRADNPATKLELSEVRPGKEILLKITPQSTNEPGSTILLIRTDYPPENPATHYAYARVIL